MPGDDSQMEPPLFWIKYLALLALLASAAFAADAHPPAKPKVAIFPLSGTCGDDLRQSVGFSLRMKLDRDGAYDAIDGPVMEDLASDAKTPVDFDTQPAIVKDLASDEHPAILIWGNLDQVAGEQGRLRLKILDLRDPAGKVREISREIQRPTDVRFVVEGILQTLPGVKEFAHPSEEEVHHDADSDAAWAKNPNLVIDGDFSKEGHWTALYMSEKYLAPFSDALPATDKVVIYRQPNVPGFETVLAMKLSTGAAENNGMACLSDAIPIEPGVRYRIQFDYKSDGPTLHVFVKGYVKGQDIAGKPALREVYRRQVSPTGATNGEWKTIESDMNPQNIAYPVDCLKVDLYAYLTPGTVMFDNIQLKAVGQQTAADVMNDPAFTKPATRPAP